MPTPTAAPARCLYLAFELSRDEWLLAFATAPAEPARRRKLPARDLPRLAAEIAAAKARFHLPTDAPVRSCYEAGRDGFWLHRWLVGQGVDNVVVDAGSMEVSRRRKQPKTDRIDAQKLLEKLQEYHAGRRRVWAVVNVPSEEDEDARHLHRGLTDLKDARTLHGNRIQGLLMGAGICRRVDRKLPGELDDLRDARGEPLKDGLKDRIRREYAQWLKADEQVNQVEYDRKRRIAAGTGRHVEKVRQLLGLKGIGLCASWVYVREFFGWRQFTNRRQVGALAGLVGVPHQSGQEDRDRGISKAGNRAMRRLAVEVAWCWVRHQPGSDLTKWFRRRFGSGRRLRKVGIVAVARKLLVALWKYLEAGEVPAGAVVDGWEGKVRYRRVAVPA